MFRHPRQLALSMLLTLKVLMLEYLGGKDKVSEQPQVSCGCNSLRIHHVLLSFIGRRSAR
jgi:hypothetical protein